MPIKYSDFVDVFSPEFAAELPKYISINDYAIDLIENQQPYYGLIYSL